MADEIEKIIAKAIKSADRSIFGEDYTKQAKAVVKAVNGAGWAIVPTQPDEAAVKAGMEQIEAGRYRPTELIKALYTSMVRAARL